MPLESFPVQTRDIYIAPNEAGLWQGALRDPAESIFGLMAEAAARRESTTIDLLYSDQVGGQRTVSRFTLTPVGDDRWNVSAGKHWNLDSVMPR